MKTGEISEPIELPKKGYIVFLVKEKKRSHIPNFSEAIDAVKETLISIKANELAKNKASDTLQNIKQILLPWEV